jgi:hypothetical protein
VGDPVNPALRRIRALGGPTWRRVRPRLGIARRRFDATVQGLSRQSQTAMDQARWDALQFRCRNGLFRVRTLAGTVDPQAVPVVMCLWNRPQRIDDILRQLDEQSDGRGVRLLLWNNQPADDAHYRDRIAAYRAKGTLRSVEYVQSAQNVGGIGRLFLARRLLRNGYRGHFLMLDDDQDVTPDFIGSMLRYAAPREYAGWWAYNYIDSHWNRTATEPGEIADYAGTGGSVCDVEIVRHSAFFTDLPRRFAFLEDQWLCAYAKSLGWKVRKADVDITFVLHETNQFLAYATLKDEFREYLRTTGPGARERT